MLNSYISNQMYDLSISSYLSIYLAMYIKSFNSLLIPLFSSFILFYPRSSKAQQIMTKIPLTPGNNL